MSLGTVQAQASIISVQWNSPTGYNSEIVPYSVSNYTNTYNGRSSSQLSYNSWTQERTEVVTAPTTTRAGQAYIYRDTMVNYDVLNATWKYDKSWGYLRADSNDFSNGKYLVMSGNITATQDTAFSFSLSASGRYHPGNTPFGEAAPALPSFYFGSSLSSLSLMSNTNTTVDSVGHSYDSDSDSSNWLDSFNGDISLTAGTPKSFAAVVYAANDVSLYDFSFNLQSVAYDYASETRHNEYTSSQLIGASILAPVPEPEEWAMMLLGLPMAGWVAGRKKSIKGAGNYKHTPAGPNVFALPEPNGYA